MSTIESLENSMKVAIRIRAYEEATVSNHLKVNATDISLTHNETNENFTYDYVFDELSSQSEIYSRAISNLAVKFLDGFNVTVFAYGQTGSGKTFTIGSSNVNAAIDDNEGIISRTLRTVLRTNQSKIRIRMSLIEIYKDKVIDLLDVKKGNCIIQNYQVKGLTKLEIVDMSSMAIIQKGILLRKVGKTSNNEKSSRSHLIFTIYLEDHQNLQSSRFNIIDLAGSEKAGLDYKNSSSSKTVFEEGSYINASLMDLRLLIKKIAGKRNVSFQANSLTKLLKDSLGSNSYSLLIACIDSRDICFKQTLETLRFANTVKSIKNKPFKLTSTDTLDKNLLDELYFLRNKFNKQFCDKGSSPIKFSNSSNTIQYIGSENCSSIVPNIEYEENSILASDTLNEETCISKKRPSSKINIHEGSLGRKKNMNKLEEFSKKKRFSKVGLNAYCLDDYLSFKFMFLNSCFDHLNNSPQFPSIHQCRKLNKGVSVVFRCFKFYSEKCMSQIKFNYINKDDSIEIISKNTCDHFKCIDEKYIFDEEMHQTCYKKQKK